MPEPLPSVSLIVLNWNGKRHLEASLGALTALDYPAERLEVILADNGSTDGSADLVRKRFPQVKLLGFDRNHGFATGNNMAARTASGEWLGFLNNDMKVEKDWLRSLLAGLEQCPTAASLASKIVNWDGSALDFIGGGVDFTGHGFQVDTGKVSSPHDHARRLLFACGGAMLIRRDVYEEVGGFDDDFFAYFEDVDLGWRLNVLGYDVWYVPTAVAFHRHHSTGRKLKPHKLRLLYERNALYTIYKSLDDAHLAAALPASLYLLNERALRISELDRRDYLLDPGAEPPEPRRSGRPQTAYAFDPAAAAAESVPQKVRRILDQEGVATLGLKAVRYARYRGRLFGYKVGGLLAGGQGRVVHQVSLSHYAALSDFVHNLEPLMEKRRWLQERRRRPDAEIIPLMVDPLWANYTEPGYLEFHRRVVEILKIDRCFGVPQ